MILECVTRNEGDGLPDVITDTSTLSIDLDNAGLATLSITVTVKEGASVPFEDFCNFELNNGKAFKGFLSTDNPTVLSGTDFKEHKLTFFGRVC